jgi:hypothetical protein
MCEENRFGHMNRNYGMHHHMKGGHSNHEKGFMMNKAFMKIMDELSDEDKKKLLDAKMDMKISSLQQKAAIMKEKKKIMAAKMDMKASRLEKKIEMLQMIRDMLND